MKRLLLLLSLLAGGSVWSQQPSWVWVNPYPTGQMINQVYFFNENEGVILGEAGTLMRTINGGDTWEQLNIPGDAYLIKMINLDASSSLLLGRFDQYSGVRVFKSTDSGLTWNEKTLPGSFQAASDITFLDSQHGWIVGDNGLVFRTSDGGETWQDKSIFSGLIPQFKMVRFVSPTDGLALGRAYLNTLAFVVARSSNGGDSWDFRLSGLQNEMRAAELIDETSLVTVGSAGLVLKSDDLGANWTFPVGLPTQELNSVDFYDAQRGIAGGELGNIIRTQDGGASWQEVLSGFSAPLRSVQFVSEDFVVAGGSQQAGFGVGASILLSTDGGNIWTNKARFIDQFFPIFGLQFTSPQRGWIAGSGYIYGTEDAGLSWHLSRVSLNEDLRDLLFVDADKGFAAGNRAGQALILSTTNGGQSWQAQTFANLQSLYHITFPAPDTGYAVGEGGIILKTGNGGQSWMRLNSGSFNPLFDVEFISPQVGWLPNGNTVLKTLDGGASWSSTVVSSFDFIRLIGFTDANAGYVASYNYLYKTGDGGETWEPLPTFFSSIQDFASQSIQSGNRDQLRSATK